VGFGGERLNHDEHEGADMDVGFRLATMSVCRRRARRIRVQFFLARLLRILGALGVLRVLRCDFHIAADR
jgi:hypothetical protein